MEYRPISPFKRPILHTHLQPVAPKSPAPSKPVGKWQVLRDLAKAKVAFGVTERDLVVLQGLISFFPDDAFDGDNEMIVFPSNAAICERLNGMACSTMRRHLARLVETGLLIRRDSPNGKRYVRRYRDARVVYGFDLSPLYMRGTEIARAAEAVREAEDRYRHLRERVSLMRRDLAALAVYGAELLPGLTLWTRFSDTADTIARALRRKLTIDDLCAFQAELVACLDQARDVIDGPVTEEMITTDAHSGQHHLNSDKDSYESEEVLDPAAADMPSSKPDHAENMQTPKIPLHMVTSACPSLQTFYQGEIRHWHQLFDAASHIRPAMGISSSAWNEAQRIMGPEQASVVVVAMLERFAEIKSPGGYLRALVAKAANGAFSCGPMIMALTGRLRTT